MAISLRAPDDRDLLHRLQPKLLRWACPERASDFLASSSVNNTAASNPKKPSQAEKPWF
jgi:hypothetical protein